MMNKKLLIFTILPMVFLFACDDDEGYYNFISIRNQTEHAICAISFEDVVFTHDTDIVKRFKTMIGRTEFIDSEQEKSIPVTYRNKWNYKGSRASDLSALYVAVYSPVDSIRHVSSIVSSANALSDGWTPDMPDTLIHTSVEGRNIDVFLYVYPQDKLRTMPSTIQIKFDGTTN